MPRRAGNPNWGKDAPAELHLNAFDVKVRELGLTPDQYIRSQELRAWAAAHKNVTYVPETLLKIWRLIPNSLD